VFKLVGFAFKFFVLGLVVLIIGNWLTWRGATISDQVKTQMAKAERSSAVRSAKPWFENLKKSVLPGGAEKPSAADKKRTDKVEAYPATEDHIDDSEKAALRSMLRKKSI
jgi:hypothetical protein